MDYEDALKLIQEAALKGAKILDLRDNQLTELPSEIASLTNLQYLYLDGNPLTSPPPAIVEQGLDAIRAYLREQQTADRRQWVSKMLVLGRAALAKRPCSAR